MDDRDQQLEDWMVIRLCREAEKRVGGKMRTYAVFRWGVNCCIVTPDKPWRARLRVRWLWFRCLLLRLVR